MPDADVVESIIISYHFYHTYDKNIIMFVCLSVIWLAIRVWRHVVSKRTDENDDAQHRVYYIQCPFYFVEKWYEKYRNEK